MTLICGAGAFGTALAVTLARTGPVTLWARDPDHAAEMRRTARNARRLPDIPARGRHRDLGAVPEGDAPCLLAMPMQTLGGFLTADHARARRAPAGRLLQGHGPCHRALARPA